MLLFGNWGKYWTWSWTEREKERETCSVQVWRPSWSLSFSHSPLAACVGSLCHGASLGAHSPAPSWILLPPGRKEAPAALHRTAGETGPSPGTTAHTGRRDVVHLERVSGLSKTLTQNQNRPSSLVEYEETQPESVSPMAPKRTNKMLTWNTGLPTILILPDWYHCVGFRNINSTEEDIGAKDLLVMGNQITCDGK